MKLRNKKTGIIGNLNMAFSLDKLTVETEAVEGARRFYHYGSLAELNEEWEDYEQPKGYIITEFGAVVPCGEYATPKGIERAKSIGNWFETKEEAEKAVEKLKAWKRLKDAGFEFGDWFDRCGGDGMGTIVFHYKADEWNNADLDLLFGGEE